MDNNNNSIKDIEKLGTEKIQQDSKNEDERCYKILNELSQKFSFKKELIKIRENNKKGDKYES